MSLTDRFTAFSSLLALFMPAVSAFVAARSPTSDGGEHVTDAEVLNVLAHVYALHLKSQGRPVGVSADTLIREFQEAGVSVDVSSFIDG